MDPSCGIDLAFAIDSSASITEPNFEVERYFPQHVIDALSADMRWRTKIALVSFSESAPVRLYFNSYEDLFDGELQIQKTEFDNGITNLTGALHRLRTEVGLRSGDVISSQERFVIRFKVSALVLVSNKAANKTT